MKKQFSAHQYKDIYKDLDIDLSKLGCLMLDVDSIPYEFGEWKTDIFYSTSNKDRFWIDGFVGSKSAHVTLLYGFLEAAHEYKKHIELLLRDTQLDGVVIEAISYFDSPYEDEEYYCVVGEIKLTEELLEANEKLQLLPHLRTFPGYKAHVTIGYIKKDEKIRDEFIKSLQPLVGLRLKSKGLNFGGNK